MAEIVEIATVRAKVAKRKAALDSASAASFAPTSREALVAVIEAVRQNYEIRTELIDSVASPRDATSVTSAMTWNGVKSVWNAPKPDAERSSIGRRESKPSRTNQGEVMKLQFNVSPQAGMLFNALVAALGVLMQAGAQFTELFGDGDAKKITAAVSLAFMTLGAIGGVLFGASSTKPGPLSKDAAEGQ